MSESSPDPATQAAPGWYPQAQGGYQYWDGVRWVASAPPPGTSYPAGSAYPETSGLAIGALVAAFVFPIVGLILGYVARRDIDRSGGTKTGRGLATAAIVIGWVFTVVTVLWVIVIISLVATSRGTSVS
jgi:hypothetical protein